MVRIRRCAGVPEGRAGAVEEDGDLSYYTLLILGIVYVYFLSCICYSIFLSLNGIVYSDLGLGAYNSFVLAPRARRLHY